MEKTHNVALFSLDPKDIKEIRLESIVTDTIDAHGNITYRQRGFTELHIISKNGSTVKATAHLLEITHKRKADVKCQVQDVR